ncbi:cell cycle checkpoint protein RAD17 [Verticillium alfalfae VaMs.102]|uniref:Cell cycle checkpoint protein RAD17 n=1 Tax=Verticillium alfalfae (strain VaMs.102 / ATCC MYA-4576 / FGSC 10136) TaxID=526221 RepID=C9SLZ2_VERA1|nr:cell cycle checkpoint protein RAD17 [Verticillium alfalfae VaMs.102]EEY19807.1 cell cycle checkpoint protein RAD17 [Verticillium alfalfae VaMs.102]
MAPPAKRRKKNVESDDDYDHNPDHDNNHDNKQDHGRPQHTNTLLNFLNSSPTKPSSARPTPSPSPTKPKTGTSRNGLKHDTRSPSTSPVKPRSRAPKRTSKTEEKGRSGDLLALFSRQAQKAPPPSKPAAPLVLDDDIVSDPISEDDVAPKAGSASFVGLNARKRSRDGTSGGPSTMTISATTTTTGGLASSSQKFLRPPRPSRPAALDDDLRPWSERFAPVSLDELAVHKKKVVDVRRWLEDVLAGRLRQRVLLLKGAAGAGKTTTMRLLARELGCELLEWRNPTGPTSGGLGFQSASAQFQEFLGRGGKFGQLEMDGGTGGSESSTQALDKGARRIILVEEFPNTFARSSTALTSFRNALLAYLAANTPSLSAFGRPSQNATITPVVMVISETLLTTTSASADSFTAHRLLGPEILRHPGVGVIEFNAIAPSILAKALELVVIKEARKSGRKRTPGPLVLKRLGEIGDIRSAISSLEFLCLKGDQEADWGAKVAFTKAKRGSKELLAMTKGEEESLELISQREASLGIFHAVGKVVYNKRDELPPKNDTVEILPSYLTHHARPKRSQVSVDALIDETGTDTHTFVSALHENYLYSCESPSPLDPDSSLDYVNGCLEYLSLSDLLSPSWDIFFGGRGPSGGYGGKDSSSHVLRQDEMTFQVAVRGMLFSLPSPVKRKTPPGVRGSDAFKMFYPTSIKLWRTKEEFEGLVDHSESPRPQRRRQAQGAGSRHTRLRAVADRLRTPLPAPQTHTRRRLCCRWGAPRAGRCCSSGCPTWAQIARGRKGGLHSIKLRDIEKVVSFQGIGTQRAGEDVESGDEAAEADGGPMSGEAWATDKPSEEASPRKKAARIRTVSEVSVSGLGVSGLVLSDDDIEDDD